MSIWFDLTTSLESNGMTGTVRAELEICRALQGCLPGVRFYRTVDSQFVEMTAQEWPWVFDSSDSISTQFLSLVVNHARQNQAVDADVRRLQKFVTSVAPSAMDRTRMVAGLALSFIPEPVAETLVELLGPYSRAGLETVERVSNLKRKQASRAAKPKPVSHPFLNGDLLISLGIDWGSENVKRIAEIKRTVALQFCQGIWDLTPVVVPHFHTEFNAALYADFVYQVSKTADAIVYCSKHSQKDGEQVQKEWGLVPPKSSVIRLGGEIPTQALQSDAECSDFFQRHKLAQPFLLFVSTIEARKNHETVFLAYRELLKRHGERMPQLVFAGRPGWKREEFVASIGRDKLTRGRVLVFSPDEAQLDSLYRRCLFTVYPSQYEGWGLPMVESQDYGKLVLASDAASLREAASELAVFVPTLSVSAWVDAIAKYAFDSKLVARAEKAIARKHKRWSWSDCGKQVANVIREMT
jgi:glycosyltransferase involved in cell wall biosynthesis